MKRILIIAAMVVVVMMATAVFFAPAVYAGRELPNLTAEVVDSGGYFTLWLEDNDLQRGKTIFLMGKTVMGNYEWFNNTEIKSGSTFDKGTIIIIRSYDPNPWTKLDVLLIQYDGYAITKRTIIDQMPVIGQKGCCTSSIGQDAFMLNGKDDAVIIQYIEGLSYGDNPPEDTKIIYYGNVDVWHDGQLIVNDHRIDFPNKEWFGPATVVQAHREQSGAVKLVYVNKAANVRTYLIGP